MFCQKLQNEDINFHELTEPVLISQTIELLTTVAVRYSNSLVLIIADSTLRQVKTILDEVLEKLPEEYNMSDITSKTAERSPYILVCFQECERMNHLISEMRRSLKELDLGLKVRLYRLVCLFGCLHKKCSSQNLIVQCLFMVM